MHLNRVRGCFFNQPFPPFLPINSSHSNLHPSQRKVKPHALSVRHLFLFQFGYETWIVLNSEFFIFTLFILE